MIALLAFAAIALVRFLMRKKQSPADEPLRYAAIPQAGARRVEPAMPAATSAPRVPVPAGFDVDGFLRVAKLNFVRLQAANDKGDLADLREFLSPEVYAEVKLAIDERQGATQQTDVVTLDAELLEVVSEGDRHVASVRFSGMLREEAGAAAAPFAEVWNLCKPVSGERGWTIAGIQQLA
jgi:predicted lipid-binding transport protein (Tim44 family)